MAQVNHFAKLFEPLRKIHFGNGPATRTQYYSWINTVNLAFGRQYYRVPFDGNLYDPQFYDKEMLGIIHLNMQDYTFEEKTRVLDDLNCALEYNKKWLPKEVTVYDKDIFEKCHKTHSARGMTFKSENGTIPDNTFVIVTGEKF